MQLYVIRHATAEEAGPGQDDADRVLTDDGQVEAGLDARVLALLGVRPSVVLTSPYARALQTARPIATVLDAPLIEDPRIALGLEPGDFAALTERFDGEVVLVGHEPDLSELVGYLTGAKVTMPKSGIARIEATTLRKGGCELRWLLRPRQIRLIAGTRVAG